MKYTFRTILIVVSMATLLLSACGGAPAEQSAVKVDASLTAYTGTVDSIDGNQWVVNGQPLSVDPSVVRDGPFQAGDTVKVEGSVNPDGSFTVTRVEMPTAEDLTQLPQIGDPQTEDNANDANTNDTNTNDVNDNDDNSNDDNANDDDDNGNSNDNDDDDNSNLNFNGNSNDDDDDDINNSNLNNNDDDDDDDSNDNDDDDEYDDDYNENSNSSNGNGNVNGS